MKIVYLSFLVALTLVVTGCDEKEFVFVGALDTEAAFDAEGDGTFTEKDMITFAEISDALEVPDDITSNDIESVQIELVQAKVVGLTGNAVNAINLTVGIQFSDETFPSDLVSNYNVEVQTANDDFVDVTGLSRNVVLTLKDKFNTYVTAIIDGTPLPNEAFTVTATGVASPSGRIVADVEVKIKASITFKQDLEVPFFMGN